MPYMQWRPMQALCKSSNNRFCKHTTKSIIHTPGRCVDGSATCVARGRAAVAASIAMNAKQTCKLSNVLAAWCVAAIVCTCVWCDPVVHDNDATAGSPTQPHRGQLLALPPASLQQPAAPSPATVAQPDNCTRLAAVAKHAVSNASCSQVAA